MPFLLSLIKLVLQCCVEFLALNCSLQDIPLRTSAESYDPTAIRRYQLFFAFKARSAVNTS